MDQYGSLSQLRTYNSIACTWINQSEHSNFWSLIRLILFFAEIIFRTSPYSTVDVWSSLFMCGNLEKSELKAVFLAYDVIMYIILVGIVILIEYHQMLFGIPA